MRVEAVQFPVGRPSRDLPQWWRATACGVWRESLRAFTRAVHFKIHLVYGVRGAAQRDEG